jgi:hypothetical protein
MSPNPVAYAHRQGSVALRAKTKQPDLYGRSTTKQPDLYGRSTTKQPDLYGRSTTKQPYARSSPSPPPPRSPPAKALGERGCQAVFIKRRDFGEINDTVRQGAKFAEGSETEPIEH